MTLPNLWSILIDRKQVPLHHNIVLILCDEGDGLVAVTSRQ